MPSRMGGHRAGEVSGHFGRCPYFTVIRVQDGRITDYEVIANPHYERHQPGAVPAFIRELARHHTSGQLSVAPEHCQPRVLQAMRKPPIRYPRPITTNNRMMPLPARIW